MFHSETVTHLSVMKERVADVRLCVKSPLLFPTLERYFVLGGSLSAVRLIYTHHLQGLKEICEDQKFTVPVHLEVDQSITFNGNGHAPQVKRPRTD